MRVWILLDRIEREQKRGVKRFKQDTKESEGDMID
jgi:hypothetical protein